MAALYLITFLAAACSLVYEFLIAQAVSFYAGNTIAWYSIIVGAYLAAMGLGSFLSGKQRIVHRPWRALLIVELMLCLVGFLAVPVINAGYLLQVYGLASDSPVLELLAFFPLALLVVLVIGLLVGFELPLLIAVSAEKGRKNIANRILAVDYLGCLVGSVAFPLLLLPRFELHSIGFLTALANCFVALVVIALSQSRSTKLGLAAVTACSAACIAGLVGSTRLEQYFLQRFYYSAQFSRLEELFFSDAELPQIERHSSPYQKIDFVTPVSQDYSEVVRDAFSSKYRENPALPQKLMLFINGDLQFSADFEEFYHEWFAHVPIIRSGAVPKKVLIIGGGDGLLLREVLKYRDVQSVLMVELDPLVVDLAKTHPKLLALNQNAFSDPRVRVTFTDGYPFIRANQELYDAIYLDLPHASDYNLSRLYSREFYHFAQRSLSPAGFIAQDANGIEALALPDDYGEQAVLPENMWEYYYSTLRAAGFDEVTPFFINLESDNEEGIRILKERVAKELVDVSPEMLRRAAERFLRLHAYTLQMGFIFLRHNEAPLASKTFWEAPGVRFHALNKRRFNAAFTFPFSSIKRVDQRLVNSIMRPTLPQTPFFTVRIPLRGERAESEKP